MVHKTRLLFFTLVILVFTLTSCNFPGFGAEPGETATPAPLETAAPTEAPAEPGACLVGSWNMTDFSPFVNSLQDSMNASSGGQNFTIENYQATGVANMTFNADNTAVFTAEEYVQSYTLVTNISGQSMSFDNRLTMNGSGTANYLVEGDTITFSNQDNSGWTIMVETLGTVTELDQSLFGEPETLQLYQYSCPDADTLALKVIAIESMDPEPFLMTRVR